MSTTHSAGKDATGLGPGASVGGRTAVPYATRFGRSSMVCSVDHLASSAGVRVMSAGGTAADAAVAASAVLAVTTQHMCGMGGDLWALVHHSPDAPPAALNASGRAGSGADPGSLRAEGRTRMRHQRDVRSVPVPGCVDGWLALHARFGRLPLADVLAPAVQLAEEGFPLSFHGSAMTELLDGVAHTEDYFPGLPGLGLPEERSMGKRRSARTDDQHSGTAPPPGAGAQHSSTGRLHRTPPGTLIVRSGVAEALRAVIDGGREAFYGGDFGADLIKLGAGEYARDDLRAPMADWVTPLSVQAWGHTLWSVPPSSQGYLTLAGAWIAAELGLPADPDSADFAHLLAEAAKAAGHDRLDVLCESADGEALVAPERLGPRAAAVRSTHAARLGIGTSEADTVHLAAVDRERMGVSLIQSNASGWGALLWTATHRISLHNRGIGFSLEPGHCAEYGPRRRPPHTLAPALVTRPDGRLRAVIGTMGGDAQPQVVSQIAARLLHAGQDPAMAVAAGRWRWAARDGTGFDTWADPSRLQLHIEAHAAWADDDVTADLRRRGHDVMLERAFSDSFGHAHVIELHGPDGEVLAGASDPRALTGGVAAA